MVYDYNKRREARGGGKRNKYGQVVTLENNNEKNKLSENTESTDKGKKQTGKRKLPHPKVLSYPVAVTPDESNGSRLLIKCFKYIPPKTSTNVGFTLEQNTSGKTEKEYGKKAVSYTHLTLPTSVTV